MGNGNSCVCDSDGLTRPSFGARGFGQQDLPSANFSALTTDTRGKDGADSDSSEEDYESAAFSLRLWIKYKKNNNAQAKHFPSEKEKHLNLQRRTTESLKMHIIIFYYILYFLGM